MKHRILYTAIVVAFTSNLAWADEAREARHDIEIEKVKISKKINASNIATNKAAIAAIQLKAGPAGTAGVDGATGAQGPVGLTGAAGTNGTDGATGAQGPIGLTGAAGTNGTDGATGAQGPIGLTGAAGVDGANGTDGAQGPIGLTGANGTDGINGVDGATGAQGPIGMTGANGIDGTNGVDGAAGLQGPVGLPGLNGNDGLNGTNGLDGAPGKDGAKGLPGAAGATGLQGPAGIGGIGLTDANGQNLGLVVNYDETFYTTFLNGIFASINHTTNRYTDQMQPGTRVIDHYMYQSTDCSGPYSLYSANIPGTNVALYDFITKTQYTATSTSGIFSHSYKQLWTGNCVQNRNAAWVIFQPANMVAVPQVVPTGFPATIVGPLTPQAK